MKKFITGVVAFICIASFAADTAAKPIKFNYKNFVYYKTEAYTHEDGSNGKVGAMKTDCGWGLKCYLPSTFDFSKTYEVYAVVRGTFVEKSLKAVGGIGVYDNAAKKVVGNARFPVAKINTTEYQRIKVGTFTFNKNMYIYIGGVNPKDPANVIYVKEFEFIAK